MPNYEVEFIKRESETRVVERKLKLVIEAHGEAHLAELLAYIENESDSSLEPFEWKQIDDRCDETTLLEIKHEVVGTSVQETADLLSLEIERGQP